MAPSMRKSEGEGKTRASPTGSESPVPRTGIGLDLCGRGDPLNKLACGFERSRLRHAPGCHGTGRLEGYS